MELQSQRVWDYAGDGYVHRLITNARDGKLVEFPDPRAVTGAERSQVFTSVCFAVADVARMPFTAYMLHACDYVCHVKPSVLAASGFAFVVP